VARNWEIEGADYAALLEDSEESDSDLEGYGTAVAPEVEIAGLEDSLSSSFSETSEHAAPTLDESDLSQLKDQITDGLGDLLRIASLLRRHNAQRKRHKGDFHEPYDSSSDGSGDDDGGGPRRKRKK
jgi:hypothetical protein